MGGGNTDSHTGGFPCPPFSLPFNVEQFLAIFVTLPYPWPSLPFFFASLNFC